MKAITSKVESRRSRAGRPGSVCGLLTAAVGLLLSGCSLTSLPQAQSDPTRYYLLNATDLHGEADAGATVKPWTVGVRAVELPAYLRSPSFAVRASVNEVKYLDYARWGEPLEQGIARVLAENLRTLKNVARVSLPPLRSDDARDFEVAVRVTACEGTADGEVRFAAVWRVVAPDRNTTVADGTYAPAALRWDGHDYAQLAARLSEAVGGLSGEIGAALARPPAG